MLVSRHQNAGQNHNLPIAKNVAKFKYLRTIITITTAVTKNLKPD
jgi:hypothetical protein